MLIFSPYSISPRKNDDPVWTRLWETLIVRDYERHWLYETMRDTDCTRLWETLIEQDYERHWVYETMRDTDWTRLWETLIVRDYERHWLNKTMRDTDCTRLWETLIVRDYERHWLYETMRDTDCTRLWDILIALKFHRCSGVAYSFFPHTQFPPGKISIYSAMFIFPHAHFPSEKWVYTEFSPRKIKYAFLLPHYPFSLHVHACLSYYYHC
jgi:hypothetical protein